MIVIKHAFRNALIPIVTTLRLSIPFLIGGAVVVEQIFAWPGIGSLMITAITSRDYPVIMGVAVLICAVDVYKRQPMRSVIMQGCFPTRFMTVCWKWR